MAESRLVSFGPKDVWGKILVDGSRWSAVLNFGEESHVPEPPANPVWADLNAPLAHARTLASADKPELREEAVVEAVQGPGNLWYPVFWAYGDDGEATFAPVQLTAQGFASPEEALAICDKIGEDARDADYVVGFLALTRELDGVDGTPLRLDGIMPCCGTDFLRVGSDASAGQDFDLDGYQAADTEVGDTEEVFCGNCGCLLWTEASVPLRVAPAWIETAATLAETLDSDGRPEEERVAGKVVKAILSGRGSSVDDYGAAQNNLRAVINILERVKADLAGSALPEIAAARA